MNSKKLGIVFGLLTVLASTAEAGPLLRRWAQRAQDRADYLSGYSRTTTYYDSYSTGGEVVDRLPAAGSTRQQDGWNWVFRSTGPHSGTWVGTYPIGENAADYVDGSPRNGTQRRFEDGYIYTYDSRRGKWSTGWIDVTPRGRRID
ncbi:hypothetical protein K2X33_00935 [bacterium]|nr:hypothetical protein [bacterium]